MIFVAPNNGDKEVNMVVKFGDDPAFARDIR